MRRLHTVLIAAAVLGLPCIAVGQDLAAGCATLRSQDNADRFARIADAHTLVFSATVAAAGKELPELCRVEGQIAPTVGFLLELPTRTWNGKLLMGGCGGPCGMFSNGNFGSAVARGYALVTTDMGHKLGPGAWPSDWLWAYQNRQAQIDFGYRATHVTTVAAKEILAVFYGRQPRQSYFWGCSTGGRQALVEAQRFPHDFTGIVAGCAPFDWASFSPYVLEWRVRVNAGKDGKPILSGRKLPLIHAAVLAACDAKDGLKDGVLQDPQQCAWDPAQIVCKRADATDDCLTQEEADVVRKFYEGPRDSSGERLYWGMARGSEEQWSPTAIGTDAGPALFTRPDATYTRYMSFFDSPGASYSFMDFDYDRDPARLALTSWMYSADFPDLRKFSRAGGKMILHQGWNDGWLPPQAAIDYYETAARVVGDMQGTREFFRLFMQSGVDHCNGGRGGGEVDWLGYLEKWVEQGQAPDFIVGHHLPDAPARSGKPRYPLDPATYDRTRRVYAYPDIAKWSGRGNPDDADSWTQAPVKRASH